MPIITLPDGSQKKFEQPVTVAEVAASIGAGLAKAALAGRVNDKLVDTSFVIDEDAKLSIVTEKDPAALEVIRHSTAHLLAMAVQAIYPKAQVTIGPVIEDGFFYDFAFERPFTPEDLEKIEAKMKEIAAADLKVTRRVMERDAAVALFQSMGEKYKAEIIASIPSNEPIGLYGQGEWFDLCRGPHVPSHRQAEGLQAHEGGRRVLARRLIATRCSSASTARRGSTTRTWRPICTASRRPRSAITAASARTSTCSISRRKRRARCSGIRRAGASSSS